MWIAIIAIGIAEVIHWIYVRDRMRMIEQMNSITLHEMWEFIHNGSDMENGDMRGMR